MSANKRHMDTVCNCCFQILPVTESSKPVWPMIESIVAPRTMKTVELKVVVDYSRVSNDKKNN